MIISQMKCHHLYLRHQKRRIEENKIYEKINFSNVDGL